MALDAIDSRSCAGLFARPASVSWRARAHGAAGSPPSGWRTRHFLSWKHYVPGLDEMTTFVGHASGSSQRVGWPLVDISSSVCWICCESVWILARCTLHGSKARILRTVQTKWARLRARQLKECMLCMLIRGYARALWLQRHKSL